MARHTHQYTIADDEAVKVLLDKLLIGGSHQQRREKATQGARRGLPTLHEFHAEGAQSIFPRTAHRLRGRSQTLVASRPKRIFTPTIQTPTTLPAQS